MIGHEKLPSQGGLIIHEPLTLLCLILFLTFSLLTVSLTSYHIFFYFCIYTSHFLPRSTLLYSRSFVFSKRSSSRGFPLKDRDANYIMHFLLNRLTSSLVGPLLMIIISKIKKYLLTYLSFFSNL